MAMTTADMHQHLFPTVDQWMCEDIYRMRRGFEKAAAFVNGIFCSLANLDVRFQFDPLSLDDCRCEIVSVNEYNLLCTLKEVPYKYVDVEGDGCTGAVKVRLSEHYEDSYERACWQDVCSVTTCGKRYLNTNKIVCALHRAIQCVLAYENEDLADLIMCQFNASFITLVVNLRLDGVYKINLLPTVKLSRKFLALRWFDERISRVFNSLEETDLIESILVVAKPTPSLSHVMFRITFNDLEKRALNLDKFVSANHCIFAMRLLQEKRLFRNGIPSFSLYNLQMFTLREMIKFPRRRDWESEEFPERLHGILKSAIACLNEKANISVLTKVNVFRAHKKRDMKVLRSEYAHIRKHFKEILLFNFAGAD